MPAITSTPAPVAKTVAPKTVKTVAPGGKGKTVKKAAPVAKKAAPKAAPVERAKKDGLRKPQIRVLQALAKSAKPLTRNEISEKGQVDLAMLTDYIGSHDAEIRAKNDVKIMKSLRTLGYVKVEQHDVDGHNKVLHSITPNGRKALEKAIKDAK